MAMPKKVPVQFDPEYNLNVQQPIVDTYHPGFARVPPLGNLTTGLRALSGVFNSIAANSERQAAQEAARQDEFRESGELAARTGKQLSADAHPAFRAGFMASTGKAAQSIFLKHVQGISNLAVEAGEIDITGQAFDRFWAEALEESNKAFPSGMDAPYDNQFFVDSFNLDLAEKRGEMQADYIEKATGNVRTQFNGQTEDLLGSAILGINEVGAATSQLENADLFSQATLIDPSFTSDGENDVTDRRKARIIIEQEYANSTTEVIQERLDLAHAMATGGIGGKTTNTDPVFNNTVEATATALMEEAVLNPRGPALDILNSLMTGKTPFMSRADVRDLWLKYDSKVYEAAVGQAKDNTYAFYERLTLAMEDPPDTLTVTQHHKGTITYQDEYWIELLEEVDGNSLLTRDEKNKWRGKIAESRRAHDDRIERGINTQANFGPVIQRVESNTAGNISPFNPPQLAARMGISEAEVRRGHEAAYFAQNPVPDATDPSARYNPQQPFTTGGGERTPWYDRTEDWANKVADYALKGNLTGVNKFSYISSIVEQAAEHLMRDTGTPGLINPKGSLELEIVSHHHALAYALYKAFKAKDVLTGLFSEGSDAAKIFQQIEAAELYEGKEFFEAAEMVKGTHDLSKSLNKRFTEDEIEDLTNTAKELLDDTWWDTRISGDVDNATFVKKFAGLLEDASLYYLRRGLSAEKAKELGSEYVKDNYVFLDETPIRLPNENSEVRGYFSDGESRKLIVDALRDRYEDWSRSDTSQPMYDFGDDIENLVFADFSDPTKFEQPKYVLYDKETGLTLDLGQILRTKPDGTVESFRFSEQSYWTAEDLVSLLDIPDEPVDATNDVRIEAARAEKEVEKELKKKGVTLPPKPKSRLKGKSIWGHDIEPPKSKK